MSQEAREIEFSPHIFDPTILREYDIRGLVDVNLNADDAYAIGLAFGTFLQRKQPEKTSFEVCVGYDGRETSPEYALRLSEGLSETGIHVTKIGLGPTPMLYFAVKDRHADAGIMITGSHNPSEYNGFKITLYDAPVYGPLIQELGNIAAEGDFEQGDGTVKSVDVSEDYIERLLKDLDYKEPLHIAWDCGNGAAGEIVQRLTERLPGTHTLLYEGIDGNFPNHHPDPTVDKNLKDLIQTVKELKCDFGIAFDGDGDRIGVVDENGTILRCDILLTLYARDVLADHPGEAIIGDVKCSQVMFDEIDRLGGKGVIWKTGHSLIKAKMAEMKAPLAGELSGHIFFKHRYYGYDDAVYCAIRLINAMKHSKDGTLSSLTAHVPTLYNTPEIRFEVNEEEKFDLVPRILEHLKAENNADAEISDIDGVRVKTSDGWWLLRPSNTQNVLVARVESNTPEGLERLKKALVQNIEKIGYNPDI